MNEKKSLQFATDTSPAATDGSQVQQQIKEIVEQNEIVLFMKGTPQQPYCGFSARAVEILNTLNKPIAAVDVLADQRFRDGIKQFSNWPTIPQVFIKGEFVGGSDILTELYEKGELGTLV